MKRVHRDATTNWTIRIRTRAGTPEQFSFFPLRLSVTWMLVTIILECFISLPLSLSLSLYFFSFRENNTCRKKLEISSSLKSNFATIIVGNFNREFISVVSRARSCENSWERVSTKIFGKYKYLNENFRR